MTAAPPPRWHVEGGARALEEAEAVARAWAKPPAATPPGGWTVVKDRAMRTVLRGRVALWGAEASAYLKVRRPATALDRVRVGLRGPGGPAEGATLAALAAAGVAVPEVIGWSAPPGTALDLLLLREVEGGVPLSTWLPSAREPARRAALAAEVGRLLRRAHAAGWSGRDLHRENLLVAGERPVLLDPGTRPLGPPLSAPRCVLALGAAAHGLAPDPRRGLVALRAYLGGDRAAARRWFPLVVAAARAQARRYRRGRARRATRAGLHFDVFRPLGPRSAGVRTIDRPTEAWVARVPDLLAGPVEGARPLKDDGSVFLARLPGLDADVVVKRFAPTWRDRFRVPRAIRAFRRAHALRTRGVACPEPLLAAADASGAGVYVAAQAGPPAAGAMDLERATRPMPSGPSAFAALPPARRRLVLHRLGRFLRRLHDADVRHRDLKAPNLVAWPSAAGASFAVVDLEGARARRGRVPWRTRARDLGRLDASLGSARVSRADRVRVLRGYYAAWARPDLPLREMARLAAAASARKRRPTGAPR